MFTDLPWVYSYIISHYQGIHRDTASRMDNNRIYINFTDLISQGCDHH